MIVCLLIIFFTAEKDPLQKVSTKKISMKCTRHENWQLYEKKKWKYITIKTMNTEMKAKNERIDSRRQSK